MRSFLKAAHAPRLSGTPLLLPRYDTLKTGGAAISYNFIDGLRGIPVMRGMVTSADYSSLKRKRRIVRDEAALGEPHIANIERHSAVGSVYPLSFAGASGFNIDENRNF
jgi:hypothetical protein